MTECYFQLTDQYFNGILWSDDLSMVFFGFDDLSML
jgi:hypothetical protein